MVRVTYSLGVLIRGMLPLHALPRLLLLPTLLLGQRLLHRTHSALERLALAKRLCARVNESREERRTSTQSKPA